MQQQLAATVEEQMMVKAIREECPWETLPKRIQAAVVTKEEWHRRLLYAVFVVSSENATVAELAKTLQADLYQLQAAASFACRLGWAVKLLDPDSVLRDSSAPALPNNILCDDDEGLKSHAVTLYEAGKLGYSCIADLCDDLASLEGKKFEGVLQEFANHAFSLRCFLECLLSGGTSPNESTEENYQGGSLQDDLSFPLSNKSSLQSTDSTGIGQDGDLRQEQDSTVDSDASSQSTNISKRKENTVNDFDSSQMVTQNDSNQTTELDGSTGNSPLPKTKRNYRVNILRCESLASLTQSTLERLLLRDYDIVVSMNPLPYSSVLPSTAGPVHFGPPCYSSMTPWMKLALYTSGGCGPVSTVFMKGQRLRMLPEPLTKCEKALIWSWDHSVVGGLGGQFEGNLVRGSLLLHYLNWMTKHSAVIVQPLSINDLDDLGNLVTMDVPLPLKNANGSVPSALAGADLPEEQMSNLISLLEDLSSKVELSTVGYLRVVRLHKVIESSDLSNKECYEWIPLSLEFGIPLFNSKLCEKICQRVVDSNMLQKNDLAEHYESMQNVRKRLRELCTEYHATGPTARLLNQRGGSKNSPRQLMNIVSGRWSPFHDPSSPPTQGGTSPRDHVRLKLGRRPKCFTEVLSFDGSILRSHALTPVYEAATRSVTEDTPSPTAVKTDSEDSDTKDVVLPGVNLIFDGAELHPFDIGACLHARQPLSLIAEASAASLAIK
ncbi:hypothetical protein ACQ4PT_043222 [Festuca glaucescens]